ncbi:MAG: pyruvate kinase, partial [Calditrichaeota bacterium]|nr:pyruvate kinase [Calditrichota bacterium]
MITDINPLQKTHLTRIVATLGPASFNELGIEQLIHAGVDVFRINFSHGDHKQHSETIRRVRAVCRRLNKHISILQDLGGPKLRINELDEDHIHLYPGESICLRDGVEKGDKTCIGFTDEDWFDQVKPGERVVLGDGIIHLQIERKGKSELECKVLSGGVLRARAGLNFPESDLNLGAMRPKDWEDLKFGLENNVDVVALSFVQGPEDLIKVREVMKDYEFDPILIAKIERPEAVERIDDILEHSGGIMVARGDLGISVPLQKVPTIQKFLIKKAREQRKLVITATQMLESMTTSPMPTRAEVTDVANAVFDGTDAVMLSGETAIGVDPPLVVRRMSDILIEAEANAIFPTLPKTDRSMDSAISQVVPMLVKEIESKLVV